jgi:UDP-glucose 6-dehydrogenase
VIFLEKAISVVGGDLRIIKVVEMLLRDGYKVYTYGMELSEELMDIQELEMCPTLDEAVKKTTSSVQSMTNSVNKTDGSTLKSELKETKQAAEETAKAIASFPISATACPLFR